MNWEQRPLDEVIEYFIDYRGKTPRKTTHGIPLITAKIVKDGRLLDANEFIALEDYDNWMTRGYPEIDDIVLTTEAPLGEVALIKDKNVALAQRIITLRGYKDKLDNRFLKYWFQSEYGQYELDARASGTTVFGIKASVLKKMLVPVPFLHEQKTIASVLSSLDEKIDLLHRQNKTLEAMAETLFRQWFIEEAKEDWEEGVLGDIASNVRVNATIESIKPSEKYIGLEHIERRHIALSQYGSGSDIGSNKSRFKKHDILFGKLRPYFHKVCITQFEGICSTDILVLRAKEKDWTFFTLFAFFQDSVVEYANLASGGTRMPRADWGSLSQYPISIPPLDLVNEFNEVVTPLIEKIHRNLEQIQKLENLRDTLLPKLMSGEVRVEYKKVDAA